VNTFRIYEQFSTSLGDDAARALASVLGDMFEELRNTVTKDDFADLKAAVADLAEAQKRTEQRVEELAEAQKRTEQRLDSLTLKVEELAEAQKRTEQRVEELAEAQKRTEQRVEELAEAQKRTEQRVEELAEAQKRTEQRVGELAVSQKRIEERMDAGFRDIHNRFGVIGSRWGDGAEETFRQGLLETVKALGYSVEHFRGEDPDGFINHRPRSYDLDVLVLNGSLVIAEIKSNASGADVTEFHRASLLYEKQTGRKPDKRILIAVTIQALAHKIAEETGVIVATDFRDLEGSQP
jgi:hypothetical protein